MTYAGRRATRQSAGAILALATTLIASCSGLTPPPASPATSPPASPAPQPTSAATGVAPTVGSTPVELWVPVGSLAEARQSHTATLLPDGRVLVAGGRQAYVTNDGSRADRTLDSVELFDPSTRAWSPGPSLQHARMDHAALALADGRVLVIGGSVVVTPPNAEDVRRPELFDPAAGAWSDVDSPPIPTVLNAVLLSDGRVLAMGFGTGSDSKLARLAVWNPKTGTWRRLADPPVARVRPSVLLMVSGLVLVAGGSVPNTPEPSPQPEAWLYDPAADVWASIEPMHEGRFAHASVLLPDGTALVVDWHAAEVFDPTSGHWALTVPPVGERLGASAVQLADGRVLVVGSPGACTGTETLAEIYDPATARWSGAGSVDHIEGLTASRLFDGRVLVAGGGRPCGSTEEDFGPFADALVFDPSTVR
jgi:hypothetical protein